MVSMTNSFGSLSASDVSKLFGAPAGVDNATQNAAVTPSPRVVGASATTPITGATAGNDAAKAIKALAAQLQIERSMSGPHGSAVTSVSAAVTRMYADGTTTEDEVTSISADGTEAAFAALRDHANANAARAAAANGGQQYTMDDVAYRNGGNSALVSWSSRGVTEQTHVGQSAGIASHMEQAAANEYCINLVKKEAKQYEASPDPSGSSAQSSGGSAIYVKFHFSTSLEWSTVEAKIKELVAAFSSGKMAGQNGSAPEGGEGFSYAAGYDGGRALFVDAAQISNLDKSKLPEIHGFENRSLGGTVVDYDLLNGYNFSVVIPLKH